MGCGSCGSGGCSSNGCGRNGGCSTGGCNKLNTYDWLGNMLPPDYTESDNIYEVRFKNTRKYFFRNVNGLRFAERDYVVVESERGFDVGQLSLGGVMAQLQMRKQRIKNPAELPKIYRKANESDLESLEKARDQEQQTLVKGREIIERLKLNMKLSEVEYQGDGSKAIFYYIADHRVDFRELIKILAREFRIRVEMRQIGLRHEAGLVGGIGACGRELCCSTWLTEFKTVSTSAARYQNLSLNPMKISGLCGRLKCCLNYELDSYMDALKDIPNAERILTVRGVAFRQKTDIFKRKMWYSYPDETTWYPLDVEAVHEILKLNKKGEKAPALSQEKEKEELKATTFDFVDVVGQTKPEDLGPKRSNPKNRRRKKTRQNKPGTEGSQQKPRSKRTGRRRPPGDKPS